MPEFLEVTGVLTANSGLSPCRDGRVVLSNFTSGEAAAKPQPTCGIKYVATGTEIYRFAGKTYPVREGHFLLVPEGNGGEVQIGRSETSTTIGLCLYLPWTEAPPSGRIEEPMIFPASCSLLGRTLNRAVPEMLRPHPERKAYAEGLLESLGRGLEPLVEETVRMIDGIDALKPSTRYETMRRLNVARGHLHHVTDRRVELPELARIAGMSRFQLLRHFRDVFGAPPAAYHRDLRLQLARHEVEARRLTCSEAAHRFGFADCSSFSHAYRRLFGEAPIRSLAA